MKPTRRAALRVFALLLLTLLATSFAFAKPRAKHVVIVSFDGGKPAVMLQSSMPATMAMRSRGAGTWTAQTVMPSITLISHTSMLTGVQPAKHKITWNNWEPERGLVTVPTIFALAKQKGLTTALFAGKSKFRHLNLPGTVDDFAIPSGQAVTIAIAAAECITAKNPALCFVHFPDSDSAGHKYGWGTPEQKQAFADEDTALKTLQDAVVKAGIARDTTFLLTADHGGHDKTHGSASPEDMNIPWIAWGAGVKRNFAITAPVSTCDTAATALWLLDVPVPAEFDGKPVTSAFRR
jgi:predicted AlkP superfamily pyrophosphatase or phosphodiesterase